MKDQWYCGVDGQQYGPFTWEQLRGMAAEGRVVADSYVRRAADQQWFSAAQIPGLIDKPKKKASSSASNPAASKSAAAKNGAKPPAADSTAAAVKTSSAASAPTVSAKKSKPVPASPPPAPPAAPPSAGSSSFKLKVKEPPLAPPPAPPVDSPSGIAINVAPTGSGSGIRSGAMPVIAPATPPGKVAPATKRPLPGKKAPPNQILVIGALAGVCALLLFGIVGVVIWNMQDFSEDQQVAAVEDGQAEEDVPAEGEGMEEPAEEPATEPADGTEAAATEAAPTDVAAAEPEADAAAAEALAEPVAAEAPAEPVDPAVAAALKLVSDQPKWSNVLRSPGMRLSTHVTWKIANVWLASDLDGTFVEPPLPESLTMAPESATPEGSATPQEPAKDDSNESEPAEPPKYVFIRLEISNAAPIPRRYSGWNFAGPALLVDDANNVLPLVPPESTLETKRLQNVLIKPGQTVADTLIYEAPKKPVEGLKLLLERSALADPTQTKTTGHFAMEIPLEFLFKKPSDEEPLAVQGEPAEPAATEPAAGEPTEKPDPDAPPPLARFDDDGKEMPQGEGKPKMKKDGPPSVDDFSKELADFEMEAKKEGKDAPAPKKP